MHLPLKEWLPRNLHDLDRAARSISRHCGADVIVIIGSTATLVGWSDPPKRTLFSQEFDIYPATFRDTYPRCEDDISEEISALFGDGSNFHQLHGFYIDGVDSHTAKLPFEWNKRSVFRRIKDEYDNTNIMIIAPSLPDLAVSKLMRLSEKDKMWMEVCHASRPFNLKNLKILINTCDVEDVFKVRAKQFVESLPVRPVAKLRPPRVSIPHYPENTHTHFQVTEGYIIRKLDVGSNLYIGEDNPLGPAYVTQTGIQKYALCGKWIEESKWEVLRKSQIESDKNNEISKPLGF
jgi:hypothetical protein